MRRHRPLKADGDERAMLTGRAFQAFGVITLMLGLLVARFAWLQLIAHEQFAAQSEGNRIRQNPIAPPRGLIFDRNGVLLADNRLAYRLELIPEQTAGVDATWRGLAQLIALDEEARAEFDASLRQHRKFQNVPIKLRLSDDELARLSVAIYRFPGVEIVPYLTRFYPYGAASAHIVGYVGRLDEKDLARVDAVNYAANTHIGKIGIESRYEDLLHGTVGFERVEVNAAGRTVRVLKGVGQAPIPGKNLYLGIDIRLQLAAIAAFGTQTGAAVAIDPATFEVLAMVSVPSFDPNLYVNGISKANYQRLIEDPARPTFHRALSGTYPPGSTFKPFVGMAGLELGFRTPQDTVLSRGIFYLPGVRRGYRDWKPGGHGVINLREAMAQSVNTYFYKLALDMGIENLHDYTARFGFGAPTGIDLNGEAKGLLPNRAWKKSVSKMPWFPGETVVCGIGQGQVSVTPVQLAVAGATLAAGGIRGMPHLLLGTQNDLNSPVLPTYFAPVDAHSFIKTPSHLVDIRDAMVGVLHGPTGTARAVGRGAAFLMAGKTGTAQQISASAPRDANGQVDPRFKNQALFVGFAPAQAPKIAVGLIVEQGGSGAHAAAPVGRLIFEAFLTPQAAVTAPSAQAAVAAGAPTSVAAGNLVAPIDPLEPIEQPDLPADALEVVPDDDAEIPPSDAELPTQARKVELPR
jgi:penicillin-binding protein 2